MWKLAPFLVRNIEIVLAAMSVPVIALIHTLLSVRFDSPWKITAVAALAIGIVHGILGWVIRARQRQVRVQMLRRLGNTLSDSVLEQVNTISGVASVGPSLAREVKFAIAQLPGLVQEPLSFQMQGEPRQI